MDESGASPRASRARRHRWRHVANRVAGAAYLAVAFLALAFGAYTMWVGKLNPINFLVFALAIAGMAPVGILLLGGERASERGMDEGQREMFRAAQADALYVAYFGLFALFLGYIFFPALQSNTQIAIGIVLLLTILTWYLGYMWRRWRPL
jgi:hypothetical protein